MVKRPRFEDSPCCKTCRRCLLQQPRTEFFRSPAYDGLNSECKTCSNDRRAIRRESGPYRSGVGPWSERKP